MLVTTPLKVSDLKRVEEKSEFESMPQWIPIRFEVVQEISSDSYAHIECTGSVGPLIN